MVRVPWKDVTVCQLRFSRGGRGSSLEWERRKEGSRSGTDLAHASAKLHAGPYEPSVQRTLLLGSRRGLDRRQRRLRRRRQGTGLGGTGGPPNSPIRRTRPRGATHPRDIRGSDGRRRHADAAPLCAWRLEGVSVHQRLLEDVVSAGWDTGRRPPGWSLDPTHRTVNSGKRTV